MHPPEHPLLAPFAPRARCVRLLAPDASMGCISIVRERTAIRPPWALVLWKSPREQLVGSARCLCRCRRPAQYGTEACSSGGVHDFRLPQAANYRDRWYAAAPPCLPHAWARPSGNYELYIAPIHAGFLMIPSAEALYRRVWLPVVKPDKAAVKASTCSRSTTADVLTLCHNHCSWR